eukprot:3940263-Rhodomonas_salina.1
MQCDTAELTITHTHMHRCLWDAVGRVHVSRLQCTAIKILNVHPEKHRHRLSMSDWAPRALCNLGTEVTIPLPKSLAMIILNRLRLYDNIAQTWHDGLD